LKTDGLIANYQDDKAPIEELIGIDKQVPKEIMSVEQMAGTRRKPKNLISN